MSDTIPNIQRIREAAGQAKVRLGILKEVQPQYGWFLRPELLMHLMEVEDLMFIKEMSPDVAMALVDRIEALESALAGLMVYNDIRCDTAAAKHSGHARAAEAARQSLAGAQPGPKKMPEAHSLHVLNDDLRRILGRPNFSCGRIATLLRASGQKIEFKAEDEQAAVIHWLLMVYAEHGSAWLEEAERRLQALAGAQAGKVE